MAALLTSASALCLPLPRMSAPKLRHTLNGANQARYPTRIRAITSDSVRLARKAQDDGADVQLDIWDGMWHVWQDAPRIPEADQACAELAEFFIANLAK